MKIVLYRFKYRKNDVVKNLNNAETYTCTLRFPTNILNPIIRIQLSTPTTSIKEWSYAYIEEFGARYYFVENVNAFTNNIYDLYLHVDVLYTYIGKANAIMRSSSAFITRSENTNIINKFYVDDRVSFENLDDVSYTDLVSSVSGIVFKDYSTVAAGRRNVILSIGNSRNPQNTLIGDLQPFTNYSSNFDFRSRGDFCGYTIYALDYTQAHQFLKECIADDTKAQHIRFISVLPFELPIGDLVLDNSTGLLEYGNNQSYTFNSYADLNVYRTVRSTERYRFFEKKLTTSITGITDFTKTDSYASYSIYVPYFGFVDIDAHRLISEPTLRIYYDFNFDNGIVNYVITLDDELYSTNKCNMGINIAPNTSNAYENKKQEDANNISGIAGQVVGGIMAIAGIILSATGSGSAAGIPMAIGGFGALASSTATTLAKNHALVDQGTKGSSTSTNGLFLYDKVVLKIVSKKTSFPYASGAWLSENGRPAMVNATISSLRGYNEFGKTEFPVGNTKEEQELEELTASGVHFPSNAW